MKTMTPFRKNICDALIILTIITIAGTVQTAYSQDSNRNGDAGKSGKQTSADTRIKPGTEIVVTFPDMPETLAMTPAKMVIFIPKDYTPEKKFPLFIWINGASGPASVGFPRKITEERGVVVASFPLFRTESGIRKRKAAIATGKKWDGLYLDDADAPYNWRYHKVMLKRLEEMIPNLSDIRIHGGFSNGAHITAMLINKVGDDFVKKYNAFLLIEGGRALSIRKPMENRPIMWAWGQNSQWGKIGKIKRFASATKNRMRTTAFEMEDTDHELPKKFYPVFRKWLIEEVLVADSESAMGKIEAFVRRKKYADALKKIRNLRSEMDNFKDYEKAVALIERLSGAENKILDKSKREFKKVTKLKDNSPRTLKLKIRKLDKFIEQFGITPEADEARKLLGILRGNQH